MPIDGLPAALHGFTIAQISDLHVGPTVKAPYVRAMVERINTLNADAVAITGDLVDGRVRDLALDVASLADLRSRHGSFFVTGNHEYYSGAGEWIALLRKLGLTRADRRACGARSRRRSPGDGRRGRLRRTPLRRAPSQRSGRCHGWSAASTRLCACCSRTSRAAPMRRADAGFDVQLSGHTHGGQFWPWNLLVQLQQPFVAGLHRLRSMWVYTSRGTGYWGPPLRLGAPSEITRLRFVAAAR